jgi:multimeric flavodoxin WrbA
MQIVCIVGSPHGPRGNTARLLQEVLAGAAAHGARAEIIYLNGRNILPCNGCDACHRTGRCIQKDDFEAVRAKIVATDGLILASPNYLFSVTAQLKAFLDRCCGTVHLLGFSGKYGAAVVTSGGGGDEPIIDYLQRFLTITGIHPVGGVHATMGALPDGEFTAGLQREARRLGEKLVTDWQQQLRDPRVEMEIRAFSQRMRELVFWKKEEWAHEYQVWQSRDPA